MPKKNRRNRKNILVNIIRESQTENNITDITIFEFDEYSRLKVLFSGSLEQFNSIGKLEMGLYRFRQNILRRNVQIHTISHKKLFVLLANSVPYDRVDMKKNFDKLIALLQEGRSAYKRAQLIEDNVFNLLDKMGIYDPEGIPISVSNASNLADAVINQLREDDDWIGVIIDTVGKHLPTTNAESA